MDNPSTSTSTPSISTSVPNSHMDDSSSSSMSSSDPCVLNGKSMEGNKYAGSSKENKSVESKGEIEGTKVTGTESKEESKRAESKKNITDVPMEVDDDKDNIPRLVIEGIDDEGEETMVLTVEEAQNYILEKVKEYMKDPKINPLLVVQNEISDFHAKIQQKNEEFNRLSKVFEVLYRDQVKFLRHIGVMPKAETKTVGVGVDLPWLPETMSNLLNSDAVKPENSLSSSTSVPVNKNILPKKEPKKEATGPIECIDLTDEDTPAAKLTKKGNINNAITAAVAPPSRSVTKHPAPLPAPPLSSISIAHEAPPKPSLKISDDDKGKGSKGIVLQWDLPINLKNSTVKCFEIFGYQEKPFVPITAALWKKIGSVDPMPLPMSCTLTQFLEGFRYHFAIRAVSNHGRYGYFSDPKSIMYTSARTKY